MGTCLIYRLRFDDTATEQEGGGVEDGELSACGGEDGLVEDEFRLGIRERQKSRCGLGLLVADAGGHPEWKFRWLERRVVYISDGDLGCIEHPTRCNDYGLRLRLKTENIERISARQTETFPLSYGVVEDARMLTEHPSFMVDDTPSSCGYVAEEVSVSAPCEADIAARTLRIDRQIRILGYPAHLTLEESAEWKENASELFLSEVTEEVGLLVFGVGTTPEQSSARHIGQGCVVSCGEDGCTRHLDGFAAEVGCRLCRGWESCLLCTLR